jgi:broad specificity phosphatase PhoE
MTAQQRRPMVETYWDRGDHTYVDGPGAESFADLVTRVVQFHNRLNGHGGFTVVVRHEQFFRTYILGLSNQFTYTLDDVRGIGYGTHPPRMPNGHIHHL